MKNHNRSGLRTWAARLALCLVGINGTAFGVGLEPRCGNEPVPGNLMVLEASYGANCDIDMTGNVTLTVGAACNGRETCLYLVRYGRMKGCRADFRVTYQCGLTGPVRYAYIRGEASGEDAEITCKAYPGDMFNNDSGKK